MPKNIKSIGKRLGPKKSNKYCSIILFLVFLNNSLNIPIKA